MLNLFASVEILLILTVIAVYIVQCPFNKVEESFNTHAVHDIINLFPDKLPHNDLKLLTEHSNNSFIPEFEVSDRRNLPWDHVLFPGVVPRTFIGALMVGIPMKIIKYIMSKGYLIEQDYETSDITAQLILQMGSRFALSSFLALTLSTLTAAIHKRYGISYRLCFLVTTISQFHYLFYASRFIPNTYAAILSNLVIASWINRHYSKSIIYMALCAVIFRFDTALFFGWMILDAVFIRKQVPLTRVLKVGFSTGIFAILLSVAIDSFFWARPVWPEFEGFYFNTWLNKSSEWGTQPYFWYIYSCIPRILSCGAPLILFADHRIARDYLFPTLAYVLTFSILPHKELRFILFVTPMFNLCIASGLVNIVRYMSGLAKYLGLKRKDMITTFLFITVVLILLVTNFTASFILMRISSNNYPGGLAAISVATSREINSEGVHPAVYVNNLAAQTGFSRFVQADGVFYSKTPQLDSSSFTKTYNLIYLVLEPYEVLSFLKTNCASSNIVNDVVEQGLHHWERIKKEAKCTVPNQYEMYCSLADTIDGFKHIDTQRLLKLKRLDSFIQTYPALNVIRCSNRSIFNPFQ